MRLLNRDRRIKIDLNPNTATRESDESTLSERDRELVRIFA